MNYPELLQELNIRFVESGHHHCRPGWLQMDCPDCGPNSGKFHLGLNKSFGYFSCWVCGAKPLVPTLIALSEAPYDTVASLLQAVIPSGRPKPRPTGKLRVPKNLGPLQTAHISYLRKRGYTYQELEALWGIQGIGIVGRLAWRIYIPIQYRFKTVSWTTRTIGDSDTRYVSASPEEEAINHKHILYGLDHVQHTAIVVEGPFDVWRIGPGAIGLLGLNWTPEQLRIISSFAVRAICLDNTVDAQRRANKLADALSLFPGETYRVVLSGKDPDSSPDEEIRELRERFLD